MKTIFCALLIILTISCKPSSTAKKDNNPVEDIEWIKEEIASFKSHPFPRKSAITTYQHKGEAVYLVESCYQCPDAQSFLYNAQKEKLCTFGGMIPNTNNCPDFFNEATSKIVLWKNF